MSEVYVYLFQVESGAIKLGITNHVQRRLNQLQTGNHETVSIAYLFQCPDMERAKRLETVLHNRFKQQHLRGEWFDVDAAEVVRDVAFAIAFAKTVVGIEVHEKRF